MSKGRTGGVSASHASERNVVWYSFRLLERGGYAISVAKDCSFHVWEFFKEGTEYVVSHAMGGKK